MLVHLFHHARLSEIQEFTFPVFLKFLAACNAFEGVGKEEEQEPGRGNSGKISCDKRQERDGEGKKIS